MSKKENTTEKEQPTTVEEQNEEMNAATQSENPEENVAELQENVVLQEQVEELKDKYLRKVAEFDNYRKRTLREKLDLMKSAAQDMMSVLLPILDDFDRAKMSADDEKTEETFSEGVTLVYNKLYNILQQKGLKAMESTGNDFDPDWHEAITEIPAPTKELKGKIIDTIEKGYFLNDKLIRHAKVVIGK